MGRKPDYNKLLPEPEANSETVNHLVAEAEYEKQFRDKMRNDRWTDFGTALKSLRNSSRLSLDGLASQSGVSRRTITRYENGEFKPDIRKCVLLCVGLRVQQDIGNKLIHLAGLRYDESQTIYPVLISMAKSINYVEALDAMKMFFDKSV